MSKTSNSKHPRTISISEIGRVAVPELATFTVRKERLIFARFVARVVTLCRKAGVEIDFWQELSATQAEIMQEEGIDVDDFEDDDEDCAA